MSEVEKDDQNISETDVPNIRDALLNDSRMSPLGSGNPNEKVLDYVPTGSQKWWIALLVGLVFALISSPPAYRFTSFIAEGITGKSLVGKSQTNVFGLIIHTIFFILIIRLLLW